MDGGSIASRLLRLAAPVAVARLGIMGMGITDTVMVGQFAAHELPYLALGWAPTGVFLVGAIGLLTGVQVLSARAVGEGRPEHAGAVLRRGLILAWLVGALASAVLFVAAEPLLLSFGIAPELAGPAAAVCHVLGLSIPLHLTFIAGSLFLEAMNRPSAGAVVMWIGNGVNLALNAVFIPFLGAEGSAWATVGSRVFLAAALIGWIVWTTRRGAAGLLQRPDADAPGFSALLVVGIAAAISQVAEAGAFNGLTIIAGRIGADAVAAYQITLNIMAFVFMIALGFAAATQVLVSEFEGARDGVRASRAGWTGLGLVALAMLIAGLIFVVGAPWIARAFSADPVHVAAVAAVLPLAALALVPDGGQVVAAGALRGRGDNWLPTASHVLAYVFVMPPTAFLLGEVAGRGVAGLIEAIVLASALSVAVLAARMAHLTRRGSSPLPG